MGEIEEYWRKRFATFAEQSDDDHVLAGWTVEGLAAQKAAFVDALRRLVRTPRRFLDLGCGPGVYSRLLAADGHAVVGADQLRGVLCKAAGRASREGLPIHFAAADAYRLPFRDAAFDAVALIGVLQILSDETDVLREMARTLRPGGVLFLITRNSLFPRNRWERRLGALRDFNPYSLARRIRALGFTQVELHPVPVFRGRARLLRRLHARRPLPAGARLPALLSAQSFLLTAVRDEVAAAAPPRRPLAVERLFVVRRELRPDAPTGVESPSVDLRATPAALCASAADWKFTRRDLYHAWEQAGARCLVGFVDSAPAIRLWVALESALVTRVIPWLPRPAERAAYLFDVETLPAFRGRGLFEVFAEELLRRLQREGVAAAYARIEVHNAPSLRAFSKLGFRPEAVITEISARNRRLFWWRRKPPPRGTAPDGGRVAS